MSRVTVSKWQSCGQDTALRSLPSCQGGNGHKGPQLHVPTTQKTGEWSVSLNITQYTEESLCRLVQQVPFPPESVLHTCPRLGEAPGHCLHYWSSHSSWLQQTIGSHRKYWMAATVPAPALLQRCSSVREKIRLSFPERWGHKRNSHTVAWVFGTWPGHQKFNLIKVIINLFLMKCLKSIYFPSHFHKSPNFLISCSL